MAKLTQKVSHTISGLMDEVKREVLACMHEGRDGYDFLLERKGNLPDVEVKITLKRKRHEQPRPVLRHITGRVSP